MAILIVLPPAAKTLFEKRVLDSQKLFIKRIASEFNSIAGNQGLTIFPYVLKWRQ